MFLFELLSLRQATRPCHTAVFNFTLSWRALCFLPGGWFTAKIKQNKLLIHPIFYLSSPFVPQLLVTAYCNIALVVLYPMMSAPPTRNSQYLCCKCNTFTSLQYVRANLRTGALLHVKEKIIFKGVPLWTTQSMWLPTHHILKLGQDRFGVAFWRSRYPFSITFRREGCSIVFSCLS